MENSPPTKQPTPPAQSPKKGLGCWAIGGIVLGCLFFLGIFVGGFNSGREKAKVTITPTPQITTPTPATPTATPTPTPASTFDIPALIGKDIDGVRKVLGNPIDKAQGIEEPSKEQIELGITEWDNTFEKGEESLAVTFNYKTRKIKDFFIPTNDTSSSNQNKLRLLRVGNLKENDPRYILNFVKAVKDASKITGVIITPK